MQDWYDDVLLPKIWTEVVRKWWDKKVPTDYPQSTTTFSLDFEDNKEVVTEMEESLETEESVIAEMIPEGSYVSSYAGVYEVSGEPGEHILLSPERINSNDAIAIHYNGETWEEVQNVTVEDGYVYGDLASLSPVAVFATKKDIFECDSVLKIAGKKTIVCNGHDVIIDQCDEDQKYYCRSLNSGTKIELSEDVLVVGGTIDGTDLSKTNIAVKNVEYPTLGIVAGSFNAEVERSAELASLNVYVENSNIRSVTGSSLRVHTHVANITIKDSDVSYFIGSGEATNKLGFDVNKDVKDHLDVYAPMSTRVVNMVLENATTETLFVGGNCGYTFTEQANLTVKGMEYKINSSWFCLCSSNGSVANVNANINGVVNGDVFTTTNRGYIGTVKAKMDNSSFKNIYVTGEDPDSSVNGTIEKVSLDLGSGVKGNLRAGSNGGVVMTRDIAQNIVDYVKYSRSAEIEIADDTIEILGDKLIMK